MYSTIQKWADDMELWAKANSFIGTEIKSIRQGLFGLYAYEVGPYTFEMHQLLPNKRLSTTYWTMTIIGKTSIIPFKYVLVLTYKTLGLIATK